MSKTTKIVLGVIGGVVALCILSVVLMSAGFWFGRASFPIGVAGMMGTTFERPFVQNLPQLRGDDDRRPMDRWGESEGECPLGNSCPGQPRRQGGCGQDRHNFRMPFGMFGCGLDESFGPDGMMGPGGMMGGFGWSSNPSAEPLTIDQAVAAAKAYLAEQDLTDLQVAEVMVFDNHAYVEVRDPATGKGAIELLVDPTSGKAFPEFGPSMMWNTEYGMHASGMGGWMGRGMMGSNAEGWQVPEGDVTVTPEQARQAAQDYLDQNFEGRTASDDVESFPGYFTLHVLEGTDVVGMLSVNAYSGEVWYHQWHGELLEMEEFAE
ncbi:MAG: hypothetical protein MUO23_08790 [Anaerolineales bacterium]|nr:hypothetical protein [Anaerolineales bacterium]